MPITKERLIRLVNTAASLEATLLTTTQSTLTELQRAARGQLRLDQLIQHLTEINSGMEGIIYRESRVILEETLHWRLTHRRNERARLYQQERRGRTLNPQPIPQAKPFTLNTQQRQQTLEDIPSLSKREFIRTLEREFDMTTEEALAHSDRLDRLAAEPSADAQPQAQPGDPDADRFIEDSDDFAPPEADPEADA